MQFTSVLLLARVPEFYTRFYTKLSMCQRIGLFSPNICKSEMKHNQSLKYNLSLFYNLNQLFFLSKLNLRYLMGRHNKSVGESHNNVRIFYKL